MKQKKQKSLLYIAAFLLLLALSSPAYITYAIGFDIGDILEWSWGLQIIIPRDPKVAEFGIYFVPHAIPLLVTVIAIVLIITLFTEIRKTKRNIIYFRNYNLALSIVLIITCFFLLGSRIIPISIYLFWISGILTIIGSTIGKREIKHISKEQNNINN